MSSFWTVEQHDGIVTATYSHPPINYYVDKAVGELTELVESWNDRSVRVVILTGPGGGPFITHFHPDEILSGVRHPERIIADGPVRNNAVNQMLNAIGQLPGVVIAALNGDTMGFGMELALACDIRIGHEDESIRYGFPEVRLGVIPGSGGTQRLSRLIGLGTALDFVLRSRIVPPSEALRLGIVTEVAVDARERAQQMAREILTLPQLPVALAKRELREGANASFQSSLTIESDASVRAKLGPEIVGILEEYTSLPLDERRGWLEGS